MALIFSIVKLIDVYKDEESDTTSLAMEYVDSNEKSFRDHMKLFNLKEIKYYMYQILKAMDYCHSKGIMHRDLKPGNIMLDVAKKRVKILDWGLADFYHKGRYFQDNL